MTIILSLFLLQIPALYAFARQIQDPRYLYVLYPLLCIISIFSIFKIANKYQNRNIVLLLIIGVVLLSSSTFLELKKYDYDHQIEAFKIAQNVVTFANGTNDYYPEDSYTIPAQLPQNWPVLKSSIDFHTHLIPTNGYDSLEKYIVDSKNKGLTHLIVDNNKNRPQFLIDVFYHDEKYPYLTKVFDSTNFGYKYHLKAYRIDYNKFDYYEHLQ